MSRKLIESMLTIILFGLITQCFAKKTDAVEYSEDAIKVIGNRCTVWFFKVADANHIPDSSLFDFPEYIPCIKEGKSIYCIVFCPLAEVKTVELDCGYQKKLVSHVNPVYKMPGSPLAAPICIGPADSGEISLVNKKGKTVQIVDLAKLIKNLSTLSAFITSEEPNQINWDRLFNNPLWNCK